MDVLEAPGAGSASASSGSLAAATIGAAVSGFNAVTVTWTDQASLQPASSENSAITYSVERKLDSGSWAAVSGDGCSGAKPHGVTSCVDAPPATGDYSYRVVATFRTWTATSSEAGPVSFTLETDAVPPANAITLSGVTGGAFKSAGTVFYRGAAGGSFALTNAVSDSGPAGPASSETSALSGTSTGWTHSPSLVSTPAGGPYASTAFSWSASTTSSPGETVTGSDAAGNTAATALTFTDDSVEPAGGAVDATGLVGTDARYSTSTALSIAFGAGTDAGAGLATGRQLLRATASLDDESCGSYGGYAQVGADDPASPVADTVPAGQACYRYRYVVSDRVGNQATTTSPDIKIDTTAPAAPSFTFSALTNTYWSGSTLYFRRNAASGAFTVTAGATEPTSGIASYALPTLPASWTASAGALGVKTYSWSVADPTAPSGAQDATATNNATLTSPAAGFTTTIDITEPTTGTITYANGFYTTASVSVTFTAGSDGGSGVDPASGLLQRREATLTGESCGSFDTFATIAGGTNPTSPFTDTSVVDGKCYQYQYRVSDRVANDAAFATNTNAAGIDTAPPTLTRSIAAKTAGGVAQHVRPGSSYHLYGELADAVSGVTSVTADLSALTSGQTSAPMPFGAFSFDSTTYNHRTGSLTADATLSACSYTPTITSTDLAGNSATANASKVMVDRDLLNQYHLRLDGQGAHDQAGMAVANAGDVNADGRPDALVGAPLADNNGRVGSGSAYVVFGQATTTTIDLTSLGTNGYRIDGALAGDDLGWSIANAGDVNADGRPDALVGADEADVNGALSGSVYVVFGKTSTTTIDLAALGSQGYRIDGAAATDLTGTSVSNAGDVNDDGIPDALISAPLADHNGRDASGSIYVVFGKATTTTIDLTSLGTQGYRIDGAIVNDQSGYAVANAGDVNDDDIPDALVSSPLGDNNGRVDSGSAYVVFGKTTTTTIDLLTLGSQGYRIDGPLANDVTGFSVANAGDVNGDGRPDAVLSARDADHNGRANSGSAWVVFGKTTGTTIDLASLGSQGYRIDGAAANEVAGYSVASAGDINADGRPDALVGVPGADHNGRAESGSTYVVFGKTTSTTIDLLSLGSQGYRIDGAASGDQSGAFLASAGDVAGDGRPDLLIGAPIASHNGRTVSGSIYTFISPPCS